MSKVNIKHLLAYALVAFFIVGSIGNFMGPQKILEEYARWGYPSWFHFVTGSLELISAILIAIVATRFVGSILASCIMLSAALTVIYHGEYTHAIAPLVVLILLLLSIYLHRK
ncbi:DoxX family protein [Acinetobacter puyangensis]|uniref:DoxX family protein n=1 Tax=Acinetobacter puyangensis TaxID=1096779 RepID=UPI003A4DAD55